MMSYGYGWWGMMLCGGLVMLLILAGIVLFVIWAGRSWSHPGRSTGTFTSTEPATGDRALDILRERYARGEITKEQYDQMRRDLTG